MRLVEPCRVDGAHAFGATSVSWVPGTTRMVTASLDETVKEWEDVPDEGPRLLHEYHGHGMGVVSVAVDATGEYVASSSLDSVVRVWSLSDHSTVAMIQADASETWHLAFAPLPAGPGDGGQVLAVAGGTRGGVVVWRVRRDESAEFVAELPLPPPASVDRSAAGAAAAAAAASGGDAAAATGSPHRFALSIAYAPDGSRVACGASDGTVAVWDCTTLQPLCVCEGHTKPVRSLSFMPDCSTLLTASDDMHVNMHDVDDGGAVLESFSGHNGCVLSVAAHPSGIAFARCGQTILWRGGGMPGANVAVEA
uniref:Anaphase-promoting complex subunit 4 WD40 domain-containing protein n=1 Tax=Chlamydomonas euryale TaxID=1486919 RepID=A0A7R9YWT7_9CHLO|mmetsp:Transcript_30007/g.88997  ORF Transcript_30007/g.88997 Transcript_30007/m.88997 type:complete len:309 (+) Transcript_30007:687-1613(+)